MSAEHLLIFSLEGVGVLNKVKCVFFQEEICLEWLASPLKPGKSIFGKTGGRNDSGLQPNTLPINSHVYPVQQWNLWCSAVYVIKRESVSKVASLLYWRTPCRGMSAVQQ